MQLHLNVRTYCLNDFLVESPGANVTSNNGCLSFLGPSQWNTITVSERCQNVKYCKRPKNCNFLQQLRLVL